jgi:hypothetical protein
MTPLNQRDPRWANERLGTGANNKTTIGSHGCLITCIAMIAGITPPEVNQRLISINGYAASSTGVLNLVIWGKLTEAIPWITVGARASYDNAVVSKNLPCVIKVDGTRIGATQHWVVFIGNQTMNDPWNGVQRATNYYPALGYAIVKKTGEKENMSDEYGNMVWKSTQHDGTVKYLYGDKNPREVPSEEIVNHIGGLRSRITTLDKELGTLKAEVENREEQTSRLKVQVSEAESEIKDLRIKLSEKIGECEELAVAKGKQYIELKQALSTIESLKEAQTNGEVTLTIRDIFTLIWNQKITIKK